MMFLVFLNFFAHFFEFCIPGQAGMDRNNDFIFTHSQPVLARLGLKRGQNDVFLIF